MKKKLHNKGFTLIEIVVSVSLFVLIVLLSTSIFRGVIESQRSALASQNIQDSLRFIFESISREMRTARGDHDGSSCGSGHFKVYNTNSAFGSPDSGNSLFFENRNQQCVKVATTTQGALEITRGIDPPFVVTPDDIEIKFISFYVVDDQAGDFHSLQPRVTFVIEAEIQNFKRTASKNVKMQTTVSSRYYE